MDRPIENNSESAKVKAEFEALNRQNFNPDTINFSQVTSYDFKEAWTDNILESANLIRSSRENKVNPLTILKELTLQPETAVVLHRMKNPVHINTGNYPGANMVLSPILEGFKKPYPLSITGRANRDGRTLSLFIEDELLPIVLSKLNNTLEQIYRYQGEPMLVTIATAKVTPRPVFTMHHFNVRNAVDHIMDEHNATRIDTTKSPLPFMMYYHDEMHENERYIASNLLFDLSN